MKLFIVSTLLLLLCLVVGCSATSIMKTTEASVKMKLADEVIKSGFVADIVVINNLSEQDAEILLAAAELYDRVSSRYLQKVDLTTFQFDLMKEDFKELTQAYKVVSLIVIKHWDDYSQAKKNALMKFERQANDLTQTFDEALLEQQKSLAVASALEMGLLILKVNAK